MRSLPPDSPADRVEVWRMQEGGPPGNSESSSCLVRERKILRRLHPCYYLGADLFWTILEEKGNYIREILSMYVCI